MAILWNCKLWTQLSSSCPPINNGSPNFLRLSFRAMNCSLRTFAADWKKLKDTKEDEIRVRMAKERAVLIDDGKPTKQLLRVLGDIFLQYADAGASCQAASEICLKDTMACRLWYRCGLKLSHLEQTMEGQGDHSRMLRFKDFLGLIEKIVEDDESNLHTPLLDPSADDSVFGVRVECDDLACLPYVRRC
jgi:hypothetical protein